eukprot:4963971-Amphidinium_carterae.1
MGALAVLIKYLDTTRHRLPSIVGYSVSPQTHKGMLDLLQVLRNAGSNLSIIHSPTITRDATFGERHRVYLISLQLVIRWSTSSEGADASLAATSA